MKMKVKNPEMEGRDLEAEKKEFDALKPIGDAARMTAEDYIKGYGALGRMFMPLKEKKPTLQYSVPGKLKMFDEVKDFTDVGMLIPDGITVIDFDNPGDALIVLKIVDELGLKTTVVKTTRGIHLYFRSDPRQRGSFAHERLALGIEGDRKIGGTNAIDKIQIDGKMRLCIRYTKPNELEILPAFIFRLDAKSSKFDFRGMGEGSRNSSLFEYIAYMQSHTEIGFTHDEIADTIAVINAYILADPLPDAEIATICRDDAFLPDEEVEKIEDEEEWWDYNEKGDKVFSHNKFGDKLIDLYNVVSYNDRLYIYDDGYYKPDEFMIEQKMIKVWPKIKQTQRNEVLAYLKIQCYITDEDVRKRSDPYIINLKNGRLNIRTGELKEFTPDALDFTRLPVTYDPDAQCQDVDNLFDRVFLYNQGLIDSFFEGIGTMLIKNARYQQGLLFNGRGSNGKSTVIDVMENFIGAENYSTIPLEHLGDRFMTAELENKLANFGDDIDPKTLRETSVMKKVFAGNATQCERKGADPFTLRPYATHVYSCNSIPHSTDKSEGFYRRWVIYPLKAHFSETDPDFDPMIEDKCLTEEAKSRILNLAMAGAQRVIMHGGISKPPEVQSELEEYKRNNSNVLQWIDDKDLNQEWFLERSRDDCYADFRDWCIISGVDHINSKTSFYREVRSIFDFDPKDQQRKTDGKRYFRIRLDL